MQVDQLFTLKTAVSEFLTKLLPALPESLQSITNDFMEQLNFKSPMELITFSQNMPNFKKSEPSSYNSSPEVQLNKVPSCGYNPLQVCPQKDDEKSQSTSSAEKYQQLKIGITYSKQEINKNFFLKPTTKFSEHPTVKCSKNIDIEAKVVRDQIKSKQDYYLAINTLKKMSEMSKSSFVEKTGLLSQIKEATKQFQKDSSTIMIVYEKSTEITTPQTPVDMRSPQQQYFYVINVSKQFQQMPQPQVCQFKGYSIYSKRGFMQPLQFDMQFQLLQQQYQNQLIYKKLYF